MGLFEMLNFREHITVEPCVFFFWIFFEMSTFLDQNLYLQKVCRNNTSSAPDMSTPCDDEKRGLQFISTIYNNSLLPALALSLVFVMFASSYSDLAGGKRRIFILVPLTGFVLQTLFSMLQTVFWGWSPYLGVILGTFVGNFLGGILCVMNFTYAYLFDKTTNENRLTRVTILSALETIAGIIGKGCVGYFLKNFGFLSSYWITLALLILAMVSTLLFVREQGETTKNKVNLKDVLSIKQTGEAFKIIMLPKKPWRCVVSIWILLLIKSLFFTTFFGESAVQYLYFRYRFQWDEEKFGFYGAYRRLSSMLGALVCTLVMSKWLKIHDGIIGIFAAFCDTLAVMGYFFAQEEWQLYAVPLFDVFRGLVSSTSSSLLSQFFTELEFGRLNSVKMIFTCVGSFGGPFYGILFNLTMDILPGAIFLLSTFVNIIIFVFFCVTFVLIKNTQFTDNGAETRAETSNEDES